MRPRLIDNGKLAALMIFNVLLFSLFVWSISANAQSVMLHWTSPVRERVVSFYAEPQGAAPDEMAVLVESDMRMAELRRHQQEWEAEARTNHNLIHTKPFPIMTNEGQPDFDKAVWIPFKTNLVADLGPGDGGRWLWVSFRSRNQRDLQWEAHHIAVQTSPTSIVITNPKVTITSQPVIELQGFTSSDWGSPLEYKVLNQNGVITASGEGLVNDRYFDQTLWDYTTNYFTCYDIQLSPGTNTIELRGKDLAGFSFATNVVYLFTTAGDTKPPVISLDWPRPKEKLSGRSFTARGRLDDFTAQVTGQISANGETNSVAGLVGRSGDFWIEGLPLALGKNYLTLMAADAAGNSSSTNLMLYGVEGELSMDPVLPADQLWQSRVNVTGKVSPNDDRVWINGVEAEVKPDGTWFAKNVPVHSSSAGGTAIFDLTARSRHEMTNTTAAPTELVSAQADLGTNAVTLNPSTPVCGVFQIHIINTAQVSFVLFASTNLVNWEPVLTNSNPNTTFDFTDTNVNNYHCRFFRIVPMQ
jgi:hypothetical protein